MGTTAIILAGGKSSRFGTDKSLLRWNDKRIVEYMAQQCADFAEEILVVSNQPCKFGLEGVRELSDIFRDKGPLGGIHAGLAAAAYEKVFVTACDMPLFQPALAVRLIKSLETGVYRAETYEAAIPRCKGRLQPLFSALRRTPALRAAEELLKQDQRKLRMLFTKLHTCYMDMEAMGYPDDDGKAMDIFYNINYPADYEALLAGWIKEGNGSDE